MYRQLIGRELFNTTSMCSVCILAPQEHIILLRECCGSAPHVVPAYLCTKFILRSIFNIMCLMFSLNVNDLNLAVSMTYLLLESWKMALSHFVNLS